IAAAALYALEHNIDRLSEDHEKAKIFAKEVSAIPGFEIDLDGVQTNIVIIEIAKSGKTPAQLLSLLKSNRVLLTEMSHSAIRAVMHMDVTLEQVKEAAQIIKRIVQ
ncbi:MAG TPA: hypothetical protein VII11_08080, partial [Bacteroidota bacterium]